MTLVEIGREIQSRTSTHKFICTHRALSKLHEDLDTGRTRRSVVRRPTPTTKSRDRAFIKAFMDPPYDYGWLARLPNMPLPPTPPRRAVASPAVDWPLLCPEMLPSTPGWPPTSYSWTPLPDHIGDSASVGAKRDGGRLGSTVPGKTGLFEGLESPALGPRPIMPTTVPRSARHARPSRQPELVKLKDRLDALESTIEEIREFIESQSRRSRARRSSGERGGVQINNVLADGGSSLTLSDQAAVHCQNISLDEILRHLDST